MTVTSERSDAFTEWARANQPALGRYAVLLTTDRSAAEDLVQEALIRTYLNWGKVGPLQGQAFARRCMANLLTDWWRRSRFVSRRAVQETAAGDPYGVADDRDQILRALSRLTPRERTFVVLRHFWGLSEQETAAELGVSVGTVKSTTSRALAALRSDPELGGRL
nr:SigE family RNA polymerase sigma factor [Propionibacterium sp.]